VTRPRRVLFLTTSMSRGGAQRQIVDLATGLQADGWWVGVLAMTGPCDYCDELKAAGITFASLRMARGRPTPVALRRYLSFVRRWRPDVIHSHMVHANLLARIGRLFNPGVPVVCTVHNVVEGRRWREIAYRLTDPLASATTAVSSAAAERYVRVGAVPRDRMTFIPNGFDLSADRVPAGAREAIRRELGVGDGFLWVSLGRLDVQKGYDLLLEAFDAVRRVRPNARLAIAGDGPENQALTGMVASLELGESAQLLGDRQDAPAILAGADAFVLSSRWEGMPMVLLEAAAQRLPIVSTDVGGCREVAQSALGAVLTDTSTAAIANGMLSVMDLSPAERARIGTDLREHVHTAFDMDAVLARWEDLYSSVLES